MKILFNAFLLIAILQVCRVHSFPKLNSCQQRYKYYSRSDWEALPVSYVTPLSTPVPYVVIHHTYKPDACTTHQECSQAMKSMQAYHQSLGWDDIGYNFCVGNSGDVYEGRGWEVKGIHAGPANGVSIGICLIGDWRVNQPPEDMLQATKFLIETGVEQGYIKPDYKLVGHKQVMATECPGTALFNIISKWDHFSNKFSVI
ncbi:peptidoglycan-recognition protein LB-like [Zerene cesonia]|uniref:peptidoglycan-recognition protein LB-like n=1 Tax=Zerene cesonia TaxID=33412 RepID=UPI0018E51F47|nr:peptidoglycan-recognition protein LB-like [Zerene cesonia]